MTVKIDNRAQTQWNKSSIAYKNYQDYLGRKYNRFHLTLIDLIHISNFKGGNATINEPEKIIDEKLISYEKRLAEIANEFGRKSLAELNEDELQILIKKVNSICNLTHKESDVKIDGFSVSYLSALLHFYFPKLIPILDRRVLMNLNLVADRDINKQKQIINIQSFYKSLIERIAEISRNTGKNIREIDREVFIIKTTTANS